MNITRGQAAVLKSLYEFGDEMSDQHLVIWAQQHSKESLSSSGVRTRRRELMDLPNPLVERRGAIRMKSGRWGSCHYLTPEGEKIARTL